MQLLLIDSNEERVYVVASTMEKTVTVIEAQKLGLSIFSNLGLNEKI